MNATLLASCRADSRSRSFSSVYHCHRAPLPKHCYRQYSSYCRLYRDTQRSGVVHTAYPVVWTHLDRRPETLSLKFVLYAFHRIHTHTEQAVCLSPLSGTQVIRIVKYTQTILSIPPPSRHLSHSSRHPLNIIWAVHARRHLLLLSERQSALVRAPNRSLDTNIHTQTSFAVI